MADKRFILSVDVGGTKSVGLLVDKDTLNGIMLTLEGANPNIYRDKSVSTIAAVVNKIIHKMGIQPNDVADCVVGLAGISRIDYRNQIEKVLNEILPQSIIRLIGDAQLAHHCIWGNTSGITLVVGTGSIAVGIDKGGNFYRSGGFGYNIGDEGSGYWLGKTIITHLIANERSTDEEVVSIKDELIDHTGAQDFEDMLKILSTAENNISYLAGLTPLILNAANGGNFFVNRTVVHGAESLSDLVIELSKKMRVEENILQIGVSGSVISKSGYYRRLVEDNLLFEFSQIDWVLPQYIPVFGGMTIVSDPIHVDEFSKLRVKHV